MTRLSEAPTAPPFTPEATVGPYYPNAFVTGFGGAPGHSPPDLGEGMEGQPICVSFTVCDAEGAPVPFVIVECWQADAAGRYAHSEEPEHASVHPAFHGFQRLFTDEGGVATLYSIKPGGHAVPGTSLQRAPHLRLTLFVAGVDRLTTQVFFEGELENASDPVLQSLADPALRKRLIARRLPPVSRIGLGDSDAPRQELISFELPIVLRGDRETPFFDDWSR